MPDHVDKIKHQTLALGAGTGNKSQIMEFDVNTFGYIKRIMGIPSEGANGDTWELDVRETNDFTTAALVDSIFAADDLPLTNDEHVVDETNATMGDVTYVTESRAIMKLYAQVTIKDDITPTTLDYKFFIRIDIDRTR